MSIVEYKKFCIVFPDDARSQLSNIGKIAFTPREQDIIACIMSGKQVKKIAIFLSISPKTVENHIRNIMLKVNCHSKEGIIDYIEKSGLLTIVNLHYFNLLTHSLFETKLKSISEAIANLKIPCRVLYENEYYAIAHCFVNDLKIAGFDVSFEQLGQCNLFEQQSGIRFTLKYPGKNEMAYRSNKNGVLFILTFISYNRKSELEDLPTNFYIPGNYYFQVFEVIK